MRSEDGGDESQPLDGTRPLETYRNDGRFTFGYSDFGWQWAIGNAEFEDTNTPERDKVSLEGGFAYSFPAGEDGPIIRRACVFMTDLTKMSEAHQQRWSSFELTPAESQGVQPHPEWWATRGGHWAEGIGPFRAFFAELDAIDELFERAFGAHLLRDLRRPEDFGWVLRPDAREWGHFIHTFDKLLSENLTAQGLDAAAAPTRSPKGDVLGTLKRLEALIGTWQDMDADRARRLMSPIAEVRSARQKPAHALRQNVTDATFVRRQRDLLSLVAGALRELRRLLQAMPKNKDWSPPPWLDGKRYAL